MPTHKAERAGMRCLRALGIASSTVRDRFGMACAVGAVACLSCLIANWSHQYPVVHSRWEQELFGDLAGPAQHETLHPEANTSAEADVTAQVDQSSTMPGNSEMKPSIFQAMFSQSIAERAPENRPRFVQWDRSQERTSTPSVWLSGVIETDADEESISQSQSDSLSRL